MEWCDEVPLYILALWATDIAPMYDLITSAIGAALMTEDGTAMRCSVALQEHRGLLNRRGQRTSVRCVGRSSTRFGLLVLCASDANEHGLTSQEAREAGIKNKTGKSNPDAVALSSRRCLS